MKIPGRATPSGTSSYGRRQRCATGHFRQTNNLVASSVGVGTYLGTVDDHTDDLMRQAIVHAIARGINVIDTAINYRHQRSECIVGQAILQAINEGVVSREEIIVCSKGGFIPHPNRVEWFKTTYVDLPDSSLCMADLAEQRHCIHPDYIRDQIDRSLANLGLETIDIYYLHNPEAQLSAISPEIFYDRLGATFVVLEDAVAQGKIAAYGLATWDAFRVPPTHTAYIDLAKAQAIAQAMAGSKQTNFKFVQLPLNLQMLEGVLLATQDVNGQRVPAIQAAQDLGITPVASAAIAQGNELEKMLPLPMLENAIGLTPGQYALQFTRSIPGILTALVGMKKSEHVAANLELMTIPPLNGSVVDAILQAKSNPTYPYPM